MTTPAAMTYDSLIKDIEEYAERHDKPFIDQIPRFIMLCENRIASEVRGLGLLKVVNSTMNSNVIPKPTRWRETASINFTASGKRKDIKLRTYEYCRKFAPDESKTGEPRFYADYGYEHWLIVPTPGTTYPFELSFYERPEPLSPMNQTNWTTQHAPQLLLYGSLLEAQSFLKQDARMDTFKGLYGNAAEAVTMEAKRRAFDRNYGVRE